MGNEKIYGGGVNVIVDEGREEELVGESGLESCLLYTSRCV